MLFSKKKAARKWRAIPQKITEIEVTDPANQIPNLIHWVSRDEDLRVNLPNSLLRLKGAFGFQGGWNVAMSALQVDIETFRKFYKLFQPRDLGEMYFFDREFGPTALDPGALPWVFKQGRQPPKVANGSGSDFPMSKYFGPSTSAVIDNEYHRMRPLVRSIRERGYQPNKNDDIEGHFMQLDGEYRFYICSGKHRVSALTYLGFESIPVRMHPFRPRVIDGARVGDWPLVRSGQMSEDFALAVFRRYFEFDGTQQRDLVFGSPS